MEITILILKQPQQQLQHEISCCACAYLSLYLGVRARKLHAGARCRRALVPSSNLRPLLFVCSSIYRRTVESAK